MHRLEVVEHEALYEVDGTDIVSLRRQLDRRRQSGAHWHGLTAASLDVNARFESVDGVCVTRMIEVRVEVTIWLPVWRPSGQAAPELVERWDAALAGLRRHEDGHRRHVLDAANALFLELTALPASDSCEVLDGEVRRHAARAKARLQVKGIGYDALTHYGARQGAQL